LWQEYTKFEGEMQDELRIRNYELGSVMMG